MKFVRSVNSFVRNKRCHFFDASSHARQEEAQTPPLLDLWLGASLPRIQRFTHKDECREGQHTCNLKYDGYTPSWRALPDHSVLMAAYWL
ncbi:hypothetical protein EFS38_03980 [Dickeya undicola]|uniref:Uncharacterized protein n=1 Tax=Dickeya undicola TaxID=1577887 RepID=A0A3N0GA25_9GAMM|nr:hypothetical protein EF878_02720 [Dickeya undicola]RNM26905.1 hypothetical protein EFS38_03980 [Dickeya undicola]